MPTTAPAILRKFPDEPMCSESTDLGTTKVWCGMGWTGQPTIVEREDRTWAIFGGYDGHLHFMDVDTGQRILPDIETGDLIKGTPTIDPEGYPLVYFGSRDNQLRVAALDRPGTAEVLWQLDSEAVQPVKWNDDWDSSPIVIGDYMIVGSESSRFWVVKLNRSYDDAGLAQVAPEVVFTDEAWDEQVINDNGGDQHASVESSVTVVDDVAYFGTSAGLVLGYDLSGLDDGETPEQVFRFYTAGDNDASLVADEEGFLYAAAQNDRPAHPRAQEVGQLQKLDPSKPDNPDRVELRGDHLGGPGPVRHAGRARRRRDHHQRTGPADRPRPRHRRGPLGADAGRGGVGQRGGRGRRAPDRRLRGDDVPRLRSHRPARGSPGALGREPRWVHRGDAGRLEGPHLHRQPSRPPLHAGVAATRRRSWWLCWLRAR